MSRVLLSLPVFLSLFLHCHFIAASAPELSDALPADKLPLLAKAETYYKSRKYDEAIDLCLRALQQSKVDPENQISIYNLLGAAYVRTRAFEKAFDVLERSLENAMEFFPPEHYLIADTHYQLGTYYFRIDEPDDALKHHLAALDMRKKNFGDAHPKVAESLVGLGETTLYLLNDVRKAAAYFSEAVRIYESRADTHTLDLYVAYFYMAQAQKTKGDLDNALAYAFKTLAVVNSNEGYAPYLERCYTLLGDIYYAQAEFGKAIEYMNLGVTNSIRTQGPANHNLIRKFINLGATYGENGDLERATVSLRKSLDILKHHHEHSSALRGEVYLHLARVFQKRKLLDSAHLYMTRTVAIHLDQYGVKDASTSDCYLSLSKLFIARKQPDSSLAYIQKAIVSAVHSFNDLDERRNPTIEDINGHYDLFKLLGEKGSVLLDLFSMQSRDTSILHVALKAFELADTLMFLSRNTYQQDGSKLFFADHYHHIYEEALETAYLLFTKTNNAKYVADAFSFMEKGKAFLLAEALNRAEVFTRAGLPDSIREMERTLNSALAAYRSKLESDHHPLSQEQQRRIQEQIFQVSQKQEKLLDTIARRYPHYYQTKYQQLSRLDAIRSYAAGNGCRIIEYFWGEKNVYVLAITGKDLIFVQIPDPHALTENILAYQHVLQHIPGWKNNDDSYDRFVINARHVYTKLLSPLLSGGGEDLVIIRDGPLLLVPFESLLASGKNLHRNNFQELDYLIRHHTLSYAHSADLLLKSTIRRAGEPNGNAVLAFSYSKEGPPEGMSEAGELPGAAREIAAIEELLPGAYFFGQDATEEQFKADVADFDILHLAIHGTSDPEKQFSGTLHFRQSSGRQDDGELHVYELYDLRMKARLAVLSACESGVGKVFKGEGVFSIARAFAYAGCPSTVMTLWPVNDGSSALIMSEFYRKLSEGDRIDKALKDAKLRYLNSADARLAHPAYWAAYIPTGNMTPVIHRSFLSRNISVLIFVAALLIFLFFLRTQLTKRHRSLPLHQTPAE